MRLTAVAVLATLAAACGALPAAGHAGGAAVALSAPAGTIKETGSGLLYPLMRSWAAAYQRQAKGVTVTTASTGSGTGIAAASEGTADLGASDAYLSSGDLVKSPDLLNIPLTVSAQTVIYNLPGVSSSAHVQLDGTVLAEIYDGSITRWDDPKITAINPHVTLPAMKIVPVRRSDSSGDTFLFTSYLSTQDPTWSDQIGYGTTAPWPAVAAERAEKGSIPTLQACQSTPGCVAYNGISYLKQALAGGLGEAALANNAGQYTLPSAATVSAAVASFVTLTPPNETISMINGPADDGYPIVNYEYAVVSSHQPGAAAASRLKAFLTWIITTGNKSSFLAPVGFQPLQKDLVTLSKKQIAEIGS